MSRRVGFISLVLLAIFTLVIAGAGCSEDDNTPLPAIPPLEITTTTLPCAANSAAYDQAVEAAGGVTPYSWSITAGSPPTPITIDAATGVLSGTPGDTPGDFTFTVEVLDSASITATRELTITLYDLLQITYAASPPIAINGAAYGPVAITASGGTGNFTWSITAGRLPDDLSLDANNGQISGIPNDVTWPYTFIVTVQDDATPPQTDTLWLTIALCDPHSITTVSLPDGGVGVAYSARVEVAGGSGDLTWSLSGAPASLSIDAATGMITGTPAPGDEAGSPYTFTVDVTDNVRGYSTSEDYVVLIRLALGITTASLPGSYVGASYNETLTAENGVAPLTWSEDGAVLGTYGLTLNSDGTITGTATQAGICSFTAKVIDSDTPAQEVTKDFSIAIYGITTTILPNGLVAEAYGPELLSAAGGTTPYTWSEVGSNLTTYSLTLNPDGTITGTPTQGGTCSFTAEVTDSGTPALSAQKTLAFEIYEPEPPFVKTWGGTGFEFVRGVAVDSGGNIYCAGSTFSFGAGNDDALLLKYDASGVLQWAKTWGGTDREEVINGVAVDSSGNIYCAGSIGIGFLFPVYDALLLKYDASGTLQWARTWGGTDHEEIYGVAVDSSGNIYCVGYTASFGVGGRDAMLLKYNSSGTLQWAKTWGGTSDYLYGVALDSGGNIYCAGYTAVAGGWHALLLKYNASGAFQWAKTWGGTGGESIYGIAIDSGGNIFCAGNTGSFGAGLTDTLLLKYDASGTLQWARIWGGTDNEGFEAVAVDSGGSVYCAGSTWNFGAGGYDALLIKYDASGALQWAKTWGGTIWENIQGVAVDSGNNIYLGGNTDSYTGVWQTITTGTESSPSGTQGTPSGTETTPTGTEGSPTGTEGSPAGSETGAGWNDTLLLKNW